MSVMQEIENLYELKNKGIISQAEFEQQKKRLLNQKDEKETPSLSRNVYILLAFFLGWLGVHNFYAGYKGRGIAQIVLTLLFWLIIPLVILYIWLFVEMITVKKDAKQHPMTKINGWGIALIVLFALGSFGGVLSIIGIMVVGGVAGYTVAMNRYQANEVLDYAIKYASIATAACEQLNMENCDLVVPSFCETGLAPENQTPKCSLNGHLLGHAQVNNISVTVPVQFASQSICHAVVNVSGASAGIRVQNEYCSAEKPTLSLVFSTKELQEQIRYIRQRSL